MFRETVIFNYVHKSLDILSSLFPPPLEWGWTWWLSSSKWMWRKWWCMILSFLIFFYCSGSPLLCGHSPSFCEQGLLSSCDVQASHCSGFSFCGAGALGRPAFSSCGSQALEHRLSNWGLSCSAACGIFPDQGLNLCPCLGRQITIHCTTRRVTNFIFDFVYLLRVLHLSGYPSGFFSYT